MQNIILVAGLPASGKTSFCEYLTKDLLIPVISKDTIKQCLYDSIGYKDWAQKRAISDASLNLMCIFAEQSMRIGLPLILENNFETSSLPMLKSLIQKYNYHCIAVRFGGDLNIIYDRFIKRTHSQEQQAGHAVTESYPATPESALRPDLTFQQFKEMVTQRGIINFSIGNDLICVDSSDFSKVDYGEICRQIREKMGYIM